MPFANFKYPQGTLNAAQKEEIIVRPRTCSPTISATGVRPYTMVLVDEVVDGGCGRAVL
jgi:4-oxalocrotonate tautomerase